jgi:hypothetical protein
MAQADAPIGVIAPLPFPLGNGQELFDKANAMKSSPYGQIENMHSLWCSSRRALIQESAVAQDDCLLRTQNISSPHSWCNFGA